MRFVPNAVVQLIVAFDDLLIGAAGELIEEKGETCVVNFGDDVNPNQKEVLTSSLQAFFAEDERDDENPMKRFTIRDHKELINMVDLVDNEMGQESIGTVSKSYGELIAAYLNAHPPVITETESYKRIIQNTISLVGRWDHIGSYFKSGFHFGITLGDEAEPDAKVYRLEIYNEAYREGVLLGQKIIKGRIPTS